MDKQRLEPIMILRVKRTPVEYYELFNTLTDDLVNEMFHGAKIFLGEDFVTPAMQHLKEHGFEMRGQEKSFEDLRYWHIICSDDKFDFIVEKLNSLPSGLQCKIKGHSNITIAIRASTGAVNITKT